MKYHDISLFAIGEEFHVYVADKDDKIIECELILSPADALQLSHALVSILKQNIPYGTKDHPYGLAQPAIDL